jgi:hypothetical protein
MSELVEDDYILEQEEEEVVDTSTEPDPEVDEDSDSAPEPGEGQAKHVQFTEEQQRLFNDAVGSKVKQLRRKEQEAEELRRRLEELESRLPQQARPAVPDLPDPFALSDEEYRQSIARREQALLEQARFDSQQQMANEQRQRMLYEQQQRQQESLTEKVKDYSSRATKLGIKPEELQVAGNTVAQFGMHDSLVQYILEDDHGPLITKYLANNLTELDELSRMDPTRAAVRIETLVKQKAASLRPKTNRAPDPLDTPRGAGSSPKPKGPQGATFE